MEISWNAWTRPAAESEEPTKQPPVKGNFFQRISEGHVLAPAWQRGLSCAAFLCGGMAVAYGLLSARSSIVRTVSYLKPTPTGTVPTQVFIQSASHPRTHGYAFDLEECVLRPSNNNQLVLQTESQGMWVLDIRRAKILGKPAPEDNTLARVKILKAWKDIDGLTAAPVKR